MKFKEESRDREIDRKILRVAVPRKAGRSGVSRTGTSWGSVKDLISEGDYSTTDLEAVLGGPEGGYTGYPLFNSPDAVADTLKNAGFDLVFTANNHILDRGSKGALRTLDLLQEKGLDTTGSFRSYDEPMEIIKDGEKNKLVIYSLGNIIGDQHGVERNVA